MQVYHSLADLAKLVPAASKAIVPAPRVYNCTACRFVDPHGLVCGACLRKIRDDQADQNNYKIALLAACFDGHGMTLLRGKCAALV